MAPHEHLDELAGTLFRYFARTEYALKASGFNKGAGAAEANWQGFALAVEAVVAKPTTRELREAINFFFNSPPKKQFIVDGNIQWQSSEPSTNSRADKLLIYVRRVRNNLFHGAKFSDHWFEPDRTEALLRHSLTILTACVASVPSVKNAYDG